jgi:hypothetical protein
MTFRKWWDAEYVYITGPTRVSKTEEGTHEWDMGKYTAKSTVHVLSGSDKSKVTVGTVLSEVCNNNNNNNNLGIES